MARGSLVTPVWRPNTKVASATASDSSESLVGIAGGERTLEGQIVAEFGMDHRRRRIERGFSIGDGGQRFVIDIDQRAGVFRFGAGARHHGADRFALPAGAIDGDGMLRRRFDAL